MNQKKLQILNAAKKLFFKNGFSDTSVTDIITLAKVSKGTFYNHFSSKNECMIAIFQDIHARSVAERKIILHFNNPYDISTLEKELIVHFSIIIESSIMDIMTNNLSSKDHQDIFDLLKSRALYEVKWLGKRLSEIYGPHISNNAYDVAAMILGAIQQIALIRTIMIPSNFEIDQVVKNILTRFEPGIYSSREDSLTLIPHEVFNEDIQLVTEESLSIEEVIAEIESFYVSYHIQFNKENEEYTLGLIDSLKNSSEKSLIIKSIAFSFIKSFKGSSLYNEALALFWEISDIWI